MKFTLSWLKEHLKTDASLNDITEALTDLGLEVEGVENPLDKLENFTVGYVSNAEKHPDADKLRVCKVDTDEGELQIICGAPNAREGIYVVVAKPGVYVPGLDITIGVGKIRGIESFGMMASEREMELSDEHDGIIELDGNPAVGSKFVDYLKKKERLYVYAGWHKMKELERAEYLTTVTKVEENFDEQKSILAPKLNQNL